MTFVAIPSMQPEINAGAIRLRRALDSLGAAVEKKAPAGAGATSQVRKRRSAPAT